MGDTFCKEFLFFDIFFHKNWPKFPSSSNTDENYTSDKTVKAKFLFPDQEIITRLGNYYPFGVMSLAGVNFSTQGTRIRSSCV